MQGLTSKARGFVALGLAVLLVLGIAGSVLVVYREDHPTDAPWSLTNSGDPIPDPKDASAAIQVAQQFILRFASLDTTRPVDGYIDGILELMTTKFRPNRDEAIAQIKAEMAGKTEKSKGVIVKSGINAQDRDSATVLVLYVKETQPSTDPYETGRAAVSLRKVNGKWLVDGAGLYKNSVLQGVGN